MKQPRSILADRSGATAAEFAMVLPLLILLIFGLIDSARYIWTYNQLEKATQMGVRMAVATKTIPQGLYDYDGLTSVSQGELIPASAFGSATCGSGGGAVSCACDQGSTCPSLGNSNDDAFAAIVARMTDFFPAINKQNVEINYTYSGIGYAGNPNGSDLVPIITVRVKNISFIPITTLLALPISMPDFSSALTMEDGAGTYSN